MSHVFISYVRDNADIVSHLCKELHAKGIETWLDREQLSPGVRWQDAIREAIDSGAFFLACFSQEYSNRPRTYMNEELTLAIDELRKRPTSQSWFIPVLLNDCEIPDRSIGAGETLRAIQAVNLHAHWEKGIAQIHAVIQPTRSQIEERIKALLTGNEITQERAALDLAEMGVLAVSELIECFEGSGERPRNLAIKTLNKIGQSAVPILIEALSNENEEIRRYAVQTLGEIGDWAATDALISLLDRTDDKYVRAEAITALGNIGSNAFPAVSIALFEGAWNTRAGAALALARIGGTDNGPTEAVWPLAEKLSDEDPRVRQHVAEALNWLGDRRALHELERVILHEEDSMARYSMKSAIRELKGESPDFLKWLR